MRHFRSRDCHYGFQSLEFSSDKQLLHCFLDHRSNPNNLRSTIKKTIKCTLDKNQTSSGANNCSLRSKRFRAVSEQERGTRVKHRAKNGASKKEGERGKKKGRKLPFFRFPSFIFWLSFHFLRGQNRKSRFLSFLGLSLLRNCTETFATQANNVAFQSNKKFQLPPQLHFLFMSMLKSHIWRFTASPCVIQISACVFSPKWFESMLQSPNLIEGVMRTS